VAEPFPPVRAIVHALAPVFRRLRFSRVLRSPVVSAYHQAGLVALLSRARLDLGSRTFGSSLAYVSAIPQSEIRSLATCLANLIFRFVSSPIPLPRSLSDSRFRQSSLLHSQPSFPGS